MSSFTKVPLSSCIAKKGWEKKSQPWFSCINAFPLLNFFRSFVLFFAQEIFILYLKRFENNIYGDKFFIELFLPIQILKTNACRLVYPLFAKYNLNFEEADLKWALCI